ncbi:hypothetical protein [Azospirillum sp.]|uniref:hypothetical protein n=1 Tax=Azospirillum sp. TaxID=34012 RepID=UPI002D7300F6|nr:hypothetical protein [Azospirillum sp.]HYF90102.1 hypothetical protein [Azospirillum sp.]
MDDERKLLERRVLGFGIRTGRIAPDDPTQVDVAFVQVNGKRMLPIVEGAEALAQDLEAAFATGLGTDLLNLGFGFDGLKTIAEEENRAMQSERIRASAAAVLVRDARVRTVVEVTVAAGPPARPGRRPIHAVVECLFETVLGQRERVTFGRDLDE